MKLFTVEQLDSPWDIYRVLSTPTNAWKSVRQLQADKLWRYRPRAKDLKNFTPFSNPDYYPHYRCRKTFCGIVIDRLCLNDGWFPVCRLSLSPCY